MAWSENTIKEVVVEWRFLFGKNNKYDIDLIHLSLIRSQRVSFSLCVCFCDIIFHDLSVVNTFWGVCVLAMQYSKSFALVLKVTFIKIYSSRVSRVHTLWSALCILCDRVKQHLSVSDGCKRPVGSAQQGLPLDWLPMNLFRVIWGR